MLYQLKLSTYVGEKILKKVSKRECCVLKIIFAVNFDFVFKRESCKEHRVKIATLLLQEIKNFQIFGDHAWDTLFLKNFRGLNFRTIRWLEILPSESFSVRNIISHVDKSRRTSYMRLFKS